MRGQQGPLGALALEVLPQFLQCYEERFERPYGFFRPYLREVICRFLDCGVLRNGFARVKCKDCNHEYLLAFSCKRRHFCPSCHQKRVVEFGEWLCANVLKKVPHRHFVFSIPKILRRYFLYDRRLLHDLSCCAWKSLINNWFGIMKKESSYRLAE
jgi:ribosomal protein S27E